jgi:hypothetical protein
MTPATKRSRKNERALREIPQLLGQLTKADRFDSSSFMIEFLSGIKQEDAGRFQVRACQMESGRYLRGKRALDFYGPERAVAMFDQQIDLGG